MTENVSAFYTWQKHAEIMSSFMSVTNKRLDLIHIIAARF